MSLLFNRLGGCCCKPVVPPPRPPVHRLPILRLISRLVVAALLFGLGLFFVITLFGFIPVVIIIALILLIIALAFARR